MKTYISSVITTQLSLLTLIVLITKNKVLPKNKKSRIILAAALIMTCAFAEFTAVMLEEFAVRLRPVSIIAKYLEFCLAPTIAIVFVTAFYPIKYKTAVFIPNIVHIVLETLSLFFGFVFYIDEKNVYHSGRAYWIYFLFVFLSIIYLVYTVAKDGAHFQNRNGISLLMILGFVSVSVVFYIIDSDVRIVWLTVAIGMILFYIYYCNMVYQLDALTELLNRRAFEVLKTSLNKKAYIIVLDVDNFKGINDRMGHTVGDVCLKSVATVIRKVYGKHGLCYRVGGDEFCVVIDREIDPCKIKDLNNRLKEQLALESNCHLVMPSIAIGYAFYEPEKTKIYDVIKEADRRMYSDKTYKKSAKTT